MILLHAIHAHDVRRLPTAPNRVVPPLHIPLPPSLPPSLLTISPSFSFRAIPSSNALFVGSAKSFASSNKALPSARSVCRALNRSSGFWEAMNSSKLSCEGGREGGRGGRGGEVSKRHRNGRKTADGHRLDGGPPYRVRTHKSCDEGQAWAPGRKGGRGGRGGREGGGGRKLTCSWRFCDLAAFSPSPVDPERRLPPWLWLVMVGGSCAGRLCVSFAGEREERGVVEMRNKELADDGGARLSFSL